MKNQSLRYRTGLLCFFLFFAFRESKCQFQTLVSDSFSTEGQHIDLSRLLIWGSNITPVSAFDLGTKADRTGLTFTCISPSDSALKYGSGYTNPNSLKTSTAIDYRFPPLNRETDTLVVEFDALWDSLIQIGEGGRLVMALLYDYPANGIPFGEVDSVQKTAPFGRPAYNIRILNRAGNQSSGGLTAPGYLFYGGGLDPLGEFEKTSQWWLPGFIAQPGGFSPQTGPSYPLGPTTKIYTLMASQQHWMHFRFRFSPEEIHFWIRKSSDSPSSEMLVSRIAIPKTAPGIPYAISKLNQFYSSNISNLPYLYRWFPRIDAMRMYFRCSNRSYLANVTAAWSGILTQNQASISGTEPEVYPNPNRLGVFRTNMEGNGSFELFDLWGRKVASGYSNAGKLQTGQQIPGRYLLILHQQNQKPVRIPVLFE